ncbi:zinc ribbon domain-containing protein [Evtepia sp.]
MALANCPECGKEVSNQAEVCVYCGYPLHRREQIQEDRTPVSRKNLSVD